MHRCRVWSCWSSLTYLILLVVSAFVTGLHSRSGELLVTGRPGFARSACVPVRKLSGNRLYVLNSAASRAWALVISAGGQADMAGGGQFQLLVDVVAGEPMCGGFAGRFTRSGGFIGISRGLE